MKRTDISFENGRAKEMYYIILQNNSRNVLKHIPKDLLIRRLNALYKMAYIAKPPQKTHPRVKKTKRFTNKKPTTTPIKIIPQTLCKDPEVHAINKIIPARLPMKLSNLHNRMKLEKIPEQSVNRPRLSRFSHGKV